VYLRIRAIIYPSGAGADADCSASCTFHLRSRVLMKAPSCPRAGRVSATRFAARTVSSPAVTSDALTHVVSGHVIRSIKPRRKSNGRCCRNHCSGAGMGVAWNHIRPRHASAAASAMMIRSSAAALASSASSL